MNLTQPKKNITSAMNFYFKLVFPFLWIGGFSVATVAMWIESLGGGPVRDPDGKWIFTIMLMVGAGFILKITLPLKRVEMDGSRLWISNYFTSIAVNADQIESVAETSRMVNPRRVVIRFKRDTAFGRQIIFMPKRMLFRMGWNPHPVVAELKALATLPIPAPAGPEPPGVVRRLPGFNGGREWLGDLYATDPVKLLKRHLYAALLIGGWNALMAILFSNQYVAHIGKNPFWVLETVVLSVAAALAITSAFGLLAGGAQTSMLALQSLILSLLSLATVAWAIQMIFGGLPRSFSWAPGVFEALAGYATFLVCRFVLPAAVKDRVFVFYLPIIVAACLIPLDIGILVRFFFLATSPFGGLPPGPDQ